jgi:hypothetical protein
VQPLNMQSCPVPLELCCRRQGALELSSDASSALIRSRASNGDASHGIDNGIGV